MPKRKFGSKITITVYEVDRFLWDKFRAEAVMKEEKYGELLNRILGRYFQYGKNGNYGNTVQERTTDDFWERDSLGRDRRS